MKKCLIISFDFSKEKDGYPSISYSIASILAKFKGADFIEIEPYAFDMNNYLKTVPEDIESETIEHFKDKFIHKINDYSFIALSAYTWSENIVNTFVKIIRPVFAGKIIVGGYEITALNHDQLLKKYPKVDYYVQGYAEKSLEAIFRNTAKENILNKPIDNNDLVSPYLSGVLPLHTKKIYWESKRGCPYHCDFCEWGNAGNWKIQRIDKDRIQKEITLFKQNNIQCINILDPTFLLNEEDIVVLKNLLEIPNCEIHLQVHFAPIKGELKKQFLDLCQKYKDRIFLEFGLQTIHKEEMEVLNRKNDIAHITSIMKELNTRKINYEISIIFGIPGQTIESFKDTIAFIEENGCKKFRAFPLRLPQNSKMKKDAEKLKIKETQSQYDFPTLKLVTESYSFNYSDWEKMYSLVGASVKDAQVYDYLPQTIISILDKSAYHYLTGGLRGETKHTNINHLFIFDKSIKEQLYKFISERLQKYEGAASVLSIAGISNFASAIEKILSHETMRELCATDSSLAEQLAQDILDFVNKTKRQMQKTENPFEAEQRAFNTFEQAEQDTFEKIWEAAASFLQNTYTQDALDTAFYHKEFQNSLAPLKKEAKKQVSFQSVKEHFLDTWGGLLTQKQIQWELEIIEEQRKKFCEDLYKHIEDLKNLQSLLEPFTNELGRLWDMSKGRWQNVNFDILKQYAELLQRDASLRELAEMLGRMRQAEQEFEEEFFTDALLKPEWKAEHASKAELVGVHESDDISSMLPSEAALLSDEITDILFYKKFTEKKLQSFEYQAKILSYREESFQNSRQKTKEEAKGPFIICVDTSGSMHGTPEQVAKTLCFALLKTAVRDNRKCYVISFSTGIETLNLTDLKKDLHKLIGFLSMSFHGGTDASPALHEALRMLETEAYKKADVIMVSDFVMPCLDDQTKARITAAKESKTKFHSLVIGESENKGVIENFDNHWVYSTRNPHSILTLVKNLNDI
jgi:uncharacterized protein with von Willebrand factor type A (vWA) domain/radical SAM superfamily enzyme YgiQ (UPF0313 family)